MPRLLFPLILLASLAACGQPLFHARPVPKPTEVRFTPPDSAGAITEIRLELDGCLGFCPAYTIAFGADGAAVRVGAGHVSFGPCAVATIPDTTYRRLAHQVLDGGFFKLAPSGGATTDIPHTFLTAALSDGRVHRVERDFTPPELAPLKAAIDSIAAVLTWTDRPLEGKHGACRTDPG